MQYEELTQRDLEQLQTEELQRIAQRGLQAEDWLVNNPALKWVLAEAEKEKQRAIAALIEADPTDTSEIVKHQTTIRAANMLGGWVMSVIHQGQNAAAMLRQEAGEE